MTLATDIAALGQRVRALRGVTGLSTRELAARAGVSAGYISQIENGQANASLAVVRSIADAFGITWLELFQPASEHGRVLRSDERPRLFSEGGVVHFGITQPPIGGVEVLVTEYAPGSRTGGENYTHGDSQEICLVLRGRLRITIGQECHELGTGDSVEFRTSIPHSVFNPGDEVAEAVWVVSPPSVPTVRHRPVDGTTATG